MHVRPRCTKKSAKAFAATPACSIPDLSDIAYAYHESVERTSVASLKRAAQLARGLDAVEEIEKPRGFHPGEVDVADAGIVDGAAEGFADGVGGVDRVDIGPLLLDPGFMQVSIRRKLGAVFTLPRCMLMGRLLTQQRRPAHRDPIASKQCGY